MDYPVRLTNVRVVTASAAHQLIEIIDPTRLPKDFNYEPELSCRHVPTSRHAFHLSSVRKTMITGIKRSSDLDDIYNVLLELALYL